MGRVLILGDDTRAFLAAVRSLGRRGIEVHAAPTDYRSPALRSRYIAETHFISRHGDGGAEALDSLLTRIPFDLVIPCTDQWLVPLHANRERFAPKSRLAIPAPEHIDILFDKHRTRQLAASLDVPVAPAVLPEETRDPARVISRLGIPIVLKPRRSVSPDAVDRRSSVELIETEGELFRAIADRDPASFFFEGFFPGFGIGLSVLADRGEVLAAFQHHRIHQAAKGGSSAYRMSAPLSPELSRACGKIVSCLGYTGIAMFEFRREPESGGWILLEVNARPWGSLPLPVSLGIDFPYTWYRLLVDGVRPEPRGYRPYVCARNLELHVDFALKTLGELDGAVPRLRFLGQWGAGLAKVATGREKIDTWAMDDISPGMAELNALAARMVQRVARCLPFWRPVRKFTARARMRRAISAAVRRGAAPKIVFVCYGNICRSAFAEYALLASLSDDTAKVCVISAGTYQAGGRHSPPEALEAAQRRSVDLASHRSRHVTPELIGTASLVIVFDRTNIEALKAQFPDIRCPVIQLGALVEAPEIADPYGQGSVAFERVFDLIDRGVQVLRHCIVEAVARAHA